MNASTEITKVLQSLRAICGVGLCYYDLNQFFEFGRYGVRDDRRHSCLFCEGARALPDGRRLCEKSDRVEAVDLARQYRTPFFFECRMGMQELVLPLISDAQLVGVIFVGQSRTAENRTAVITQNARRFGGDPAVFAELYRQLPVIPRETLYHVGRILDCYFGTRMELKALMQPPRQTDAPTRMPERVRQYIDEEYVNPLSTGRIAAHFFADESYVSRSFRKVYGMTVTECITAARLRRAKALLRSTTIPVGSIALNVGFEDVNYFSRVFKAKTGRTPTAYRSGTSEQKTIG